MDKTELKKVNVIGRKYFHYFLMSDGTFKKVETTEAEYQKLTSSSPTIKGGTYHHSNEVYKYDTLTGDLGDKEYCDNGGGYLLSSGGVEVQVDKNLVVENKIDTLVVDQLITKFIPK